MALAQEDEKDKRKSVKLDAPPVSVARTTSGNVSQNQSKRKLLFFLLYFLDEERYDDRYVIVLGTPSSKEGSKIAGASSASLSPRKTESGTLRNATDSSASAAAASYASPGSVSQSSTADLDGNLDKKEKRKSRSLLPFMKSDEEKKADAEEKKLKKERSSRAVTPDELKKLEEQLQAQVPALALLSQ